MQLPLFAVVSLGWGMPVRLLVTGGAGFIGCNLVRRAARRDVDVVVVDDLSTGDARSIADKPVTFRHGSVLDAGLMAEALEGVDSVVHLAALPSVPRSIADPVASHRANATGTLALLESARAAGVSHVVTASSSSVYGRNPQLPKSERAWVGPVSPYAVSKLAAEQYTLAYQECFGLATVAFRFFNVYGPGQRAGHAYAAVVPSFVDAALRGRPLTVFGDGRQSRDFTFVGTVCEVLLDCAARKLSHPEPVNLAFGTTTSLNHLIAVLEVSLGRSLPRREEPVRPGDVRHSQADTTVLRELFPQVTPEPLESGIRRTLDWWRG